MRGALLPHLFTLTQPLNFLQPRYHNRYAKFITMKTSWQHKIQELGGIFSVALSVGLRLPGVTWHPAQWSPDFPPLYRCGKTATVQPTLDINYTLLLLDIAIKNQYPPTACGINSDTMNRPPSLKATSRIGSKHIVIDSWGPTGVHTDLSRVFSLISSAA